MVNYSEENYRTLYEEEIHEDVSRAILVATGSVYKQTLAHVKRNIEREKNNALGHWRREKMQDALMGIAQRFEDLGVKYVPWQNATGSCHFAVIETERLRLICCLGHGKAKRILPAKIRSLLAANNHSQQGDLFGDILGDSVPQPRVDERKLAILRHGPSGKNKSMVGFCEIVFPDRHNYRSIVGFIDLFAMFPAVVEANPSLFREKRSNRRKTG